MSNAKKIIDKIAAEPETEAVPDVIESLNKTVDDIAGVSAVKAPSRKADIPLDEEIAVRSVVFGGLTWKSQRSGAYYRWNEIGETLYIPFNELITMNNTSHDFLFTPFVIFQDERVVNYFRLNSVYEKIACVNNLENLFDEGNLDEIGSALRNIVNTGMRDIAISKIRTLRGEHKLTNIDVIRLIEKILCFDMD